MKSHRNWELLKFYNRFLFQTKHIILSLRSSHCLSGTTDRKWNCSYQFSYRRNGSRSFLGKYISFVVHLFSARVCFEAFKRCRRSYKYIMPLFLFSSTSCSKLNSINHVNYSCTYVIKLFKSSYMSVVNDWFKRGQLDLFRHTPEVTCFLGFSYPSRTAEWFNNGKCVP